MKFSRDEQKRKEQQQFLKDLHNEAQSAALAKAKEDAKRAKLMKIRLAKVREKKRLKLGLPVKGELCFSIIIIFFLIIIIS